MGRTAYWLGIAVIALAAATLGFWAGRVVFAPAQVPLVAPAPVTYRVEEGSVGRSVRFVAVADWPLQSSVRYMGAGVVTSLDVEAGSEVKAGTVLFTVDLHPVIAAEGSVPAFRTLRVGDRGDDVKQLEWLLLGLGVFEGEPDGEFDDSLQRAVRGWQLSLGIDSDGVVQLGDVLFFPSMPVRIIPAGELEVGAQLTPGQVAFRTLGHAPTFMIPLAADQRNLVPLSGVVLVDYGGDTWRGQIVGAVEDPEFGGLNLMLASANGQPLCGADCPEAVPLIGASDFPVEIIVVPNTTGPQVPVSAILTALDGTTMVERDTGELLPITIVATVNGLAIVDGIDPGTLIVLPSEAS